MGVSGEFRYLGPDFSSVASVRHHVSVQAGEPFPPQLPRPAVLALSVVAHALMQQPEQLEDVVALVAPQVPLDETLLLRAARKVSEQLAGRDAAATQH